MDEFSEDDEYAVEVFKSPNGDYLRVFRNGAMAIGCLRVADFIANPQVRGVIEELVKAHGIPFKSWYEEFARDD